MNEVILVNSDDNYLGTMEKMKAHQTGELHRAFSIYLVNDKGDFLLQRRAADKYHSAGLWTNTCCSHPNQDETTMAAAIRRLDEEMGIATSLTHLYHFTYRVEFANGLIEHELDHVYLGTFNEPPNPNPNEVMEWKYMSTDEIIKDVKEHPELYTEWFKLSYEIVIVNTVIN
jgi:isopentenyl-diphosphate delta-isomerase